MAQTMPGEHVGSVPLQGQDDGLILAIRNLTKRRERGSVAFELQVPEFCLFRGTFVAIVGASGCGKSTLLDLIALVLKPDTVDRFEIASDNGTSG